MLDLSEILQSDLFLVVLINVGDDPAHSLNHDQIVVGGTDHQTFVK